MKSKYEVSFHISVNVDYLYGLPLHTDGRVDATTPGTTLAAKKKRSAELDSEKRKDANCKKFDQVVDKMPSFDSSNAGKYSNMVMHMSILKNLQVTAIKSCMFI